VLDDATCDRCRRKIADFRMPNGSTAGYYLAGAWPRCANPGEQIICDDCMWNDPRYKRDYTGWVE
jgi:hypothetical protein